MHAQLITASRHGHFARHRVQRWFRGNFVADESLFMSSCLPIQLVPHMTIILDVIKLLVSGTKNERGFSGASHIVGRLLSALTSIYPKDQRFLNRDEWLDPSESHHRLSSVLRVNVSFDSRISSIT